MPFELGRPFGAPNEPDFQRRVLRDCLALLERTRGPVLEDFPDPPPGDRPDAPGEGWACPVNFDPPIAELADAELIGHALTREVAMLAPWHAESLRLHGGRSGFGISGLTPSEIIAHIAAFAAAPEQAGSPFADTHPVIAFKRMADDLRYYYTEAAIARPDGRARDIEIADWLWGETTLGAVLVAVRDWAMESTDTVTQRIAQNAMVPTHQRHRTRHG